jgi:hypothetical protein
VIKTNTFAVDVIFRHFGISRVECCEFSNVSSNSAVAICRMNMYYWLVIFFGNFVREGCGRGAGCDGADWWSGRAIGKL